MQYHSVPMWHYSAETSSASFITCVFFVQSSLTYFLLITYVI
jgi:hypothetical protein